MNTPTPTGTEARVCADIAARQQQVGIPKYGMTIEGNPQPLVEWLKAQYFELLDAAIYCKRAIEELENARAQTCEPTTLISHEN